MRNKWLRWYTSTKASAQKIVFQAAHEDKERNENVDVPA